MTTETTSTDGSSHGSPLSQLILDEIQVIKQERERIRKVPTHGKLHAMILGCCVLVNVIYFLFRSDYVALFVAASIYLNMFYFVSLLIPTSPAGIGTMKPDFPRFLTWLREIGLVSGTSRFTRLFMNTFFLNSRALTGGICLIFSIDIVYVLLSYFTMHIPFETILVVISQAVIIIAFYLLVWKIEPFSTKFVRNVENVRSRLSRENLPSWLITALFFLGFVIVFLLFISTIILLPGITVSMFLTESGLSALGYLVALLAILGISQYFFIRCIHGITSRALAERVLEYKQSSLERLVEINPETQGSTLISDNPVETTTSLLESKIFQLQQNSLFGLFTVYVVNLDFSVMLDSSTLNAIKGYIHEKP